MYKSLHLKKKGLFIENYHDDFLLLKSEHESYLTKLGKAIFLANFDFIDEVIVTEMEVCLKLNRLFEYGKLDFLDHLNLEEATTGKTYILPVYFEAHPDWELVETFANLKKEAIIQDLTQTTFSIAMFGFLPGFTYLNGLETKLQVPRKTTPSKYVEANSIAIGGPYLGIYAIDSPGGWNVIGKTPIPILEIPSLPPVNLNLGDSIQLKAINEEEYRAIQQQELSLISYNAQN